ncbi:bacteriohemerythrin [Roseospira goensis]|uniref:Hemerythrin n=1 Tax=Roseospira goensis TaxID=391922 RepID=A0A7W6WKV3_9PROT|nr:hemerythrin family protein [Roseospira goensis]MBB4286741.1 hemerythrin [Roseospira goensis]
MERLHWRTWFEVGHDTIDFEHKTFFSLIHKLQSLVEVTHDREGAQRALEETYKYADFHFTSEENIMIEAGYKDFERHHELHQKLLKRLRQNIDDMESGLISGSEVVTFLFMWFVEHTIAEDLELSTQLKKRQLRQFFQAPTQHDESPEGDVGRP